MLKEKRKGISVADVRGNRRGTVHSSKCCQWDFEPAIPVAKGGGGCWEDLVNPVTRL